MLMVDKSSRFSQGIEEIEACYCPLDIVARRIPTFSKYRARTPRFTGLYLPVQPASGGFQQGNDPDPSVSWTQSRKDTFASER